MNSAIQFEVNPHAFFPRRPADSYASTLKESTISARSDDAIIAAWSTQNAIRILTGTVGDFIGFSLSRIAEVNRLVVKQDGDVCHVWVFVDKFSEEVLDQVCDREESIIDEFPHCHFDFKVVYHPDNGSDASCLGSAKQVYTKQT